MFKAYGSSTATGRNKLLEATREETGHLDGFPLRSSQRLLISPLDVCGSSQLVQSCPTLCNPMDSSLTGFSVHGIPQARILVWVAFPPPGIFPTQGLNLRLLCLLYWLLSGFSHV